LRPVQPASSKAPPGLIDTLTGGFDHVNRIPGIIALPILLDLALWLAPRLSAAPALHLLIQRMGQLISASAVTAADPTTLDQFHQVLSDVDAASGGSNLLTLLSSNPFNLNFAGIPGIAPASIGGVFPWQVQSPGTLLFVAAGLELVCMLLGCIYLGALAQEVREGRLSLARLGVRVWSYWLSLIGFILLAVLAMILISIPIGIALAVVGMVAPVVAELLGEALAIVGILVGIYLFFLVDAVVVSEAGPLRAVVNSARVVANNFWSAVGFIILESLIAQGMLLVWTQMSKNPFGTAVAIIGNAYVMSGLAAASMRFYQTRLARLPAPHGVVGRVTQV
jgi:hypothetical protein